MGTILKYEQVILLRKSISACLWAAENLSFLSLKHFTWEKCCSMFSTEQRQILCSSQNFNCRPGATNPKDFEKPKDWPGRQSKKSFGWVGSTSNISEIKIEWEANLLLSQKNVVVGSPKNVVGGIRSDQKNVVKTNQETSPYPSENVVSGLETQWAALYAARQMASEKPSCIVLVWLYDQARTFFQSQAWNKGGVRGGSPPRSFHSTIEAKPLLRYPNLVQRLVHPQRTNGLFENILF